MSCLPASTRDPEGTPASIELRNATGYRCTVTPHKPLYLHSNRCYMVLESNLQPCYSTPVRTYLLL